MCTVDEETGIPDPIVRAVVRFVECVGPFFPAASLRMGGGNVVDALRRSTQVAEEPKPDPVRGIEAPEG